MAMAALPIAMMAGSAALTAGSQIMGGYEQARSAQFEKSQLLGQAQALKHQEQNMKIAADQDEARRRNELTSSMQTIAAIRAGRGVGEGSPTAQATFGSIISGAESDIHTSKFNILSKADEYRIGSENARLSAAQAERKAGFSIMSGYLTAGSTLLSAGGKAMGPTPYGTK